MNYVTRLCGIRGAPGYPLPIHDAIAWHQPRPGTWQCTVPLSSIPAKHLIVPSFSSRRDARQFSFELCHAGWQFKLQKVPVVQKKADIAAIEPVAREQRLSRFSKASRAVTNHIDCWHTHHELNNVSIMLTVNDHPGSTTTSPPEDCLFAVSIRPLKTTITTPVEMQVAAAAPQPISQMQANAAIAKRICSPTALTMALVTQTRSPSWPQALAHCFDPISRAYGSWPLAIQWAAVNGRLGAVEALWCWKDVETILLTGQSVVCSINYPSGHLANAAIAGTAGHLVVLQAINGNRVTVFDPAAPTHDSVPREYDLKEFSKAWLHERGAAYIFACDEGIENRNTIVKQA